MCSGGRLLPGGADLTHVRRLRVLLGVALLAAVGGACTLDGDAADFVAGESGDCILPQTGAAAALSAAAAPRPEDLCAARRAPLLLTVISDRPATAPLFPQRSCWPERFARPAWRAAGRISARAPPLG